MHLTRCGNGVSFTLASRSTPTQVVTLDLEGIERWHYDRAWGLHFEGIVGDARGLVLYGQDSGTDVSDHWVGLAADTGACVFEKRPPVDAAPKIAGEWLYAPLAEGTEGVLRTKRDGSHPEKITKLAYIASAANREVLLLNTPGVVGVTEVVAIELASGRERWRAPGGNNLEIAIDDQRAAWVQGDGCPVVYDLATGARLWQGSVMPPLPGRSGYRSRLGSHALACYCGFTSVVYYAIAATSPLRTAKADGEGAFLGDSFVEPGEASLTCWELT